MPRTLPASYRQPPVHARTRRTNALTTTIREFKAASECGSCGRAGSVQWALSSDGNEAAPRSSSALNIYQHPLLS